MTVRSSIFAKLLLASIALIAVALASTDFLLTRYTAERERAQTREQMARWLAFAAPALDANPPASLQKYAEETDAALHARITLIAFDGQVLADSRHDPETMENHASRPEVRAALSGRTGAAVRHSATLDIDFSYYAVPVMLPGHPHAVLRAAVPLSQVGESIALVRGLILRSSAIAAAIACLLAYCIARSFTRRVRRIEGYAAELVRADYSGTLAAEGDDELGSIARSLRSMAEHFQRMLDLLKRESARREAILSGMVEGVLAVDRELRITFYNDAFARAVHAPLQAPEGQSVLHIARDPALRELLARVIRERAPATARMSLLNAGGRIFDVLAAPIEESDGAGALATFHDVTELERLERVRKDFVANISHELRTPLAAIHGYTETLLDGALEDPNHNRRFLEIIASHTERINNLASDLLTLSEIEAERTPVLQERVSAVEIAEGAIEAARPRSAERQVNIFLDAAGDAYIAGQKGRLERAVLNLILNAINYNRPEGEVRVSVQSTSGSVKIIVADNGIGIASQDISRIFERFYRVDKARSRQTGGTGLGLAIVRNTVERVGGAVRVESQLGKGSVFTLMFPSA